MLNISDEKIDIYNNFIKPDVFFYSCQAHTKKKFQKLSNEKERNRERDPIFLTRYKNVYENEYLFLILTFYNRAH